ncbi:MAG: undecaprenyl-diphosphate phosphatase [Candidatus Omnitrophota bacterium]
MNSIESIFLGILQGLTEFLPISSSGHLVVAEHCLNLNVSELLFFDVLLHFATLLAVCFYFRRRLFALAGAGLTFFGGKPFAPEAARDRTFILAILLSNLITGGFGLPLENTLEKMRDQLFLVGTSFIVTGCFLLTTRLWGRNKEAAKDDFPMNPWIFAAVLGLAQTVAILPGVSRSGATICASLLLGSSAAFAVEYSFLLSVPIIFAATALEAMKAEMTVALLPCILGFGAAFLSGMFFLWLLSLIVKTGKIHRFAYYVIPLGLWVLWMSI